jgi:hypothetical protein
VSLDEELAWYEQQLKRQAKEDPVCRRLNKLPAFGPVVSSAVKCWLGNGQQFQRGRYGQRSVAKCPSIAASAGTLCFARLTKMAIFGLSRRHSGLSRNGIGRSGYTAPAFFVCASLGA